MAVPWRLSTAKFAFTGISLGNDLLITRIGYQVPKVILLSSIFTEVAFSFTIQSSNISISQHYITQSILSKDITKNSLHKQPKLELVRPCRLLYLIVILRTYPVIHHLTSYKHPPCPPLLPLSTPSKRNLIASE